MEETILDEDTEFDDIPITQLSKGQLCILLGLPLESQAAVESPRVVQLNKVLLTSFSKLRSTIKRRDRAFVSKRL